MPSKNAIKTYKENGYYHIYNRGVEKRDIFMDEKDYKVFLFYLKTYLLPPLELQGLSSKSYPSKQLKNYSDCVQLIAYCLMPNHFHLLIKQTTLDGMQGLMRSLCTKYVRYFNTRHKRVGSLFQGVYKAASIQSEGQLLEVSRYIHRNPLDEEDMQANKIRNYPYSSYRNYLKKINQTWIKQSEVLDYFSSPTSYKVFVEYDLVNF